MLEERGTPRRRIMTSWRARPLATLALVLALALAGCGSSHHSSTPTTSIAPVTTAAPPTTAPATTPTQPSGSSTSAPPTTAAPTSTTRPARTCAVSDLSISVTSPLGSAGAFHYQLVFRHTSSGTCTLYGFPGVSFLDSHGKQIGPPAQQRTSVSRQLVTLAAGANGYATLDVTDPSIPPCAGAGTVAQIRVFPPGSFAAASIAPASGMVVCTSPNTVRYTATFVGPVTAASSPGYNS